MKTRIPSDIHLGGQRLSPSMLDLWTTCPQQWYLHYLAPHPTAPTTSAGLGARTSGEAAYLGSCFHFGAYHYRLSGWAAGTDAGSYSPDTGVDAARSYALDNAGELEHPDAAPDIAAAATALVYQYTQDHAINPLLQWRTAADPQGQPSLERVVEVPLLGGRYLLTSIIDAAGYDLAGTLTAIEYKTCGARYVLDWRRGADLSAQGRSEAAGLRMMFPTVTTVGSQFELIVKDRGKVSKYDTVEAVPFILSDSSLYRFLQSVERVALEIAWSVAEWRSRLAKGEDPWTAGLEVFPVKGMQGSPPACVRFGRECDFAMRCRHPDLPVGALLGGMPIRTELVPPAEPGFKGGRSTADGEIVVDTSPTALSD